ncbi:hypothetical protein [Legionella longbeachae]|uniref:hypothetical protein n=1 Tax=Legionella longbeachae TaxID=450 RepID=UPI001404E2DA|nr:hypothetical protein [Legionella longbeachae]QIN30661.1 hypothetical protein GCB94_00180 [Legionella longbeachae]
MTIKINFTSEQINKLSNYLHFLNQVEKENYDIIDSINNGLPAHRWKTILRFLDKSHILVHPNKDGSSTTLDLTDVKKKIEDSIH